MKIKLLLIAELEVAGGNPLATAQATRRLPRSGAAVGLRDHALPSDGPRPLGVHQSALETDRR